ncbi:hypothetical protein L798_04793 [Zootermopsis nevadensis]|uniref:Uncharacterized protein n=1 Tax=Zootermopsis nevadensis TaxID=136037 RepID=A0A067QHD2_ZOONE|nr:hypothetical protein L798_04793 [Zootermopsis nevadensis]
MENDARGLDKMKGRKCEEGSFEICYENEDKSYKSEWHWQKETTERRIEDKDIMRRKKICNKGDRGMENVRCYDKRKK